MSRALVLSGGGSVGIAWEAGLLAGLAEGGVELGAADLIVGTSAGSFVGSALASGRAAADLAAAILAEADRPAPPPAASGQSGPPDMAPLYALMRQAWSGEGDATAARREIGRLALAARTAMDEAAFVASFGRQLAATGGWPSRFACTAVDADTGEFVLWSHDSGVDLARAVASSCSVPGLFPPITIGDRRWIDGGMRSGTNADLARGHARVAVVALRLAGPDAMRTPLDAEVASLRAGGAEVEVIHPDDASLSALGVDLMDARARPAAARAGLAQGRAAAPGLAAFWG